MRLFVLCVFAAAAAARSATLEDIEAKLPLIDDHIARLQQAEPWISALALVVLLAGLISAIVAAFDGVWVKRMGVILGAVVAFVSGYRSSTFGLDAQTCELVRKKAQNSLRLVRANIADFKKSGRPASWELAVKFKTELDHLEPLMEKVGRPFYSLTAVKAQSVGADTTVTAQGWGTGRCDDEISAYDLARHDALDRLVRETIKNARPGHGLIVYLRERATVIDEQCRKDGDWFTCQLRVEVPRIYLNPDIVEAVRSRESVRSPGEFAGVERHIFLSDDDFKVDGKTRSGEKFDFQLRRTKHSDGSWTVELDQIKIGRIQGLPQDWLLQFSVDGAAADLPLLSLGQSDKETRCDVSPMGRKVRVRVPPGRMRHDVAVSGQRP